MLFMKLWQRIVPTLIVLFVFLFPSYLMAQTNSPNKKTATINWQLNATVDGVEFFHAITECSGSNVVLLKFNNKNDHPVKISWKEKFTTQLDVNKEGAAGQKELVIAKGVTMPAGCDDNTRKKNVITGFDVQPHYVARISSFEFVEISVVKSK